ncbi:ABC-type sugar transport system, permease component [Longilinea arvoryzae]|uniref:ABC-type sugar transport system, permease component n=1 Tax=Longilinea arvoryzae TaxID=360412 RepID=A0A0S7BHC3_9CHLR|nr:carbohydrate ABC transporter permease [Longilinea arvoryzae]GAP13490.1 ABC-type sugar transport system, permease component [Longilinea arvoryzae]
MTALFSNRWIKWISILILILLVIFSVLPFVWMMSTSIKNSSELYTSIPKLFPDHPTLENYSYIMKRGSFGLYFRNSFLVGIGTTIASLFVSLLAGYGFSRYHFPGHKFVLFSFLMVQMFPSVLLIIPLFRLIKAFDMMNTMGALVLANTTFAVPLCTWLLKGFFDQIPHDLEEAAMIDGCSRIGAMVRVILPLALPGIIASGIYVFIGSWDELVYAMTFTSSEAIRTLPVGLSRFITSYEIQWNQLAAATVLATIPVLILFLLIQKYIAQGLISGSVKG